ncbi:MAG: hypothetical protein LC808_23010 [Actinobacteria bacterium]|nr:hypothetical protein [Actinomycetota bacterium]
MRARLSDRKLRRWLSTGKPRRVDRLLETNSAISARLDQLSRLDPALIAALAQMSSPPTGFGTRTVAAVQDRIDAYATVALVADLLGLGWHTGRAVLGDPTVPPEPESRETPEG